MIDHHVHLYPSELNRDPARWALATGETHWGRLSLRRRKSGAPVQEFPELDVLLRAMDAAGVAKAVLLGWYWEHEQTCSWHNGAMAGWVRLHPDRLSAYATVQPAAGAESVTAELWRAREEGLSGMGELSPHSVGASVHGPGMQAALRLAAEWGWPVNLHVTDPRGRAYPGRVETPAADFFSLARAWPGVRFVLAHWAGGYDVRDYPNVQVDTAAAPLIYGDAAWGMRGTTVRAEQVVFGSDFPLCLNPAVDAVTGWNAFVDEARKYGVVG